MKLDSNIAAIVTGGASGLGEATARMLAGHGVRVTLFDMNRERGGTVASDIGGAFAEVNVAEPDSVATGFETARGAHGPARILVNCAGIGTAMKTIARDRETKAVRMHDLALFARTVNVNLVGTFNCIAHAAADMVDLDPVESDQRRCRRRAGRDRQHGLRRRGGRADRPGGLLGLQGRREGHDPAHRPRPSRGMECG